jgi:hypothetical protein
MLVLEDESDTNTEVIPHTFIFLYLSANALIEAGDTYKQIEEYKYILEDSVQRKFLEPLHQLQSKDFTEVQVRSIGYKVVGRSLPILPLTISGVFEKPGLGFSPHTCLDLHIIIYAGRR